jgi:hypothetical protein
VADPTVEIPRYPSLFRQSGPRPRGPGPRWGSVPWEVLTGVVIGVTLAYLAVTLIDGYGLLHAAEPLVWTVIGWSRWAMLGYVAAFALWLPATRRLLVRRGDVQAVGMRHWSLTLWGLSVIVSLVLTRVPGLAVARAGVRIAVAGLLLVALWTVGDRVRALTVHHGQTGHSEEDDFWAEVAALTNRAGVGVPVLEAWPTSIRRWHLAQPGRVAEVRRAVVTGARVTVFATPPRPVTERLVEDLIGQLAPVLAPGGEPSAGPGTGDPTFIGLIEEAEGGALRFARLGTAAEIMPWLERVRFARRCGVYRSGSPGAPTTTVHT